MLRNVKVIILTAVVLFIAVFLVLFSGCKIVAPESNSGEQLSAGIEVVDIAKAKRI